MSVVLALLLLPLLPAQEEDPRVVEYREQYARYSEIQAIEDPLAQLNAALDFLEEGVTEYQTLDQFVAQVAVMGLQKVTGVGDFDAVYPAADRLSELYPPYAGQAGGLALGAAIMADDSEQIVRYGEPFYQANANAQIALYLARAYDQLDNRPKMLEYARIVLDSDAFPIADVFGLAYTVLQDDDQAGRDAEAVGLAKEIRAGVPSAPAGVAAADWDRIQIYLLDLIGRSDFQAERYAQALASYNEIVNLDSCNGKAWYFKGNSMLRVGEPPNEASAALARAVLIEGTYSTPARTLLESTATANGPGAAAQSFMQNVLSRARTQVASCG
jgi:tetratricopeptide (TPR) repeat protein